MPSCPPGYTFLYSLAPTPTGTPCTGCHSCSMLPKVLVLRLLALFSINLIATCESSASDLYFHIQEDRTIENGDLSRSLDHECRNAFYGATPHCSRIPYKSFKRSPLCFSQQETHIAWCHSRRALFSRGPAIGPTKNKLTEDQK